MKTPDWLKRSGKNIKLFYYIRCFMRYLTPPFYLRHQLGKKLDTIASRSDKAIIDERVDYYNKLKTKSSLPKTSKQLREHKLKGNKSVYFFDTYEFTRWFPLHYKWCYLFGDINYIAKEPSIVKSRPIGNNNENSVLLNLDKVRHFCFLNDKIPFTSKMNKIISRGDVYGKPNRQLFMEMYFDHPLCDVGDIAPNSTNPMERRPKIITLYEHLKYKFIMTLEGNDVASNLKWVMSSNSLAVMPRPTCETWFMEGRLIPNYHYVEIKPDFSDLIERTNYYIENPDKAQEIIDHAHEYIRQFQDKKREKLISLLVLEKYFTLTNESCRKETGRYS